MFLGAEWLLTSMYPAVECLADHVLFYWDRFILTYSLHWLNPFIRTLAHQFLIMVAVVVNLFL